jgi:hypothetical protein
LRRLPLRHGRGGKALAALRPPGAARGWLGGLVLACDSPPLVRLALWDWTAAEIPARHGKLAAAAVGAVLAAVEPDGAWWAHAWSTPATGCPSARTQADRGSGRGRALAGEPRRVPRHPRQPPPRRQPRRRRRQGPRAGGGAHGGGRGRGGTGQKGQVREWKFEPKTFEFDGIKRGCRFYTPDFWIEWADGRTEYHEVKGYMDPKSATKLKRMKKYFPDVEVLLVDRTAYQALARQLRGIITGWEWNGKHGY